MVVSHRLGLLVRGVARHGPRRGHRHLPGGSDAPKNACRTVMYRVEPHAGEWLGRARPLRFRFEGHEYQGYAGDTISSALAAAGVPYLGRSFKYHRPRGIL